MWLICFRQFSPMGKICWWCLEESTYPLGGAFWAQSRNGIYWSTPEPHRAHPFWQSGLLIQGFLHQRGLTHDFLHRPAHHPMPMCSLCRPLQKESSSSPGSPWLCSHSLRAPEPFTPGKGRWPCWRRDQGGQCQPVNTSTVMLQDVPSAGPGTAA